MSILLAKPAKEDVEKQFRDSVPLAHIISVLESLDLGRLDKESRVRRIFDADGEIYVLKERGVRVFFTRKSNDLVILSITTN